MKRPAEEFREVMILKMWLDMIPHDIGRWAYLVNREQGFNLDILLGTGEEKEYGMLTPLIRASFKSDYELS
jgi:hypothetical protein